jgi:hypothetical protein
MRPPVPVVPVTGPNGFSALIYQCMLNVDWDGSPQAYGLDRPDIPRGQQFPLQKGLQPHEVPANNGSLLNAKSDDDHSWVGVFSRTPAEARQLLRDHYPGFAEDAHRQGPD